MRLALPLLPLTVLGAGICASGCRDSSRFSSRGDHYEGAVVQGSFVRAGINEDAQMCVSLDADHLQDAPGMLSTSDGRFHATPLRPIPQIWHDPLSTLAFGDGRVQNLVYVASPITAADPQDVVVFVSLMSEGGIEVRLVRGAPQSDAGTPDAGPATTTPPLFGVFALGRHEGTCSF